MTDQNPFDFTLFDDDTLIAEAVASLSQEMSLPNLTPSSTETTPSPDGMPVFDADLFPDLGQEVDTPDDSAEDVEPDPLPTTLDPNIRTYDT